MSILYNSFLAESVGYRPSMGSKELKPKTEEIIEEKEENVPSTTISSGDRVDIAGTTIKVVQSYSEDNKGINVSTKTGKAVALNNGVVEDLFVVDGRQTIVIKNSDGTKSTYGNMNLASEEDILKLKGKEVIKGQELLGYNSDDDQPNYVSIVNTDDKGEVYNPTDMFSIINKSVSDVDLEGMSSTQKKKYNFYKKYYPIVKEKVKGTGLHPEVVISQMALESGWGESGLATKENAFFGVKSHGYKGKTSTWNTQEKSEGKEWTEEASFRGYDSAEESIDDYLNFLQTNKRYNTDSEEDGKANIFTASTPEEHAKRLQQAKYAGDNPEYASDLIAQMTRDWDLIHSDF